MSRRGVVLFVLLGITWGIPYAFIKIAVGEISPEMVVFGRSAIAAVILVPVAAVRGELRAPLRHWRALLVYTVIELVLPWFFLTKAETRLPSSTAGLLLAAVPLVAVGAAVLLRRAEHLSPTNWAGILVGMGGVAALVGFDVSGSDLISVAEIAVTVVGYAVAPIIVAKWMGDVPGIGLAAWSFALNALVYIPIVTAVHGWPTRVPSVDVIIAVLILGVICSALAFVMLFELIRLVGPVRATAVTYINPAVAIVAGALLLGEAVTVWTIVGFLLVITGSWLVNRRRTASVSGEVQLRP